MSNAIASETVSVMQAAQRLRISYHRALRRVLIGELDGFQDECGRWHVVVDSLPTSRDR